VRGQFLLIALAALTAARLLVAGLTPLSPDEAYYWVWSKAPAAGYLDHPPMVAWWIAAGTFIAGDGALGVRLFSPLAAAVGSLLLARAGNRLFPEARPGVTAAALLNASLLFGIGGVTMTPDTPLLLFWTLALVFAADIVATGRGWRGVGVAAGLALLSKYTAALLAPSVLAWLLASRETRFWPLRRAPWIAAALSAALFTPVLLWNADHEWASFRRQGGRAADWDPARALQFFAELVGGQIGLATPLIALLCTAGMVAAIRRARKNPAWGLLAGWSAIPALVFVEHALGDRVQANWPAIVYPAAAIAAAMLGGGWTRLRPPALALGLAMTLLVWAQGIAAPFPLPRAIDPTLMRLGGWPGLAATIAARADAENATFVAADNYGVAAELARLMPPPIPVLGVDPRWAFFALPDGAPVIAGRAGLLVRSVQRNDPPDPADWSTITPIGDVARARDGVIAERYRLYRVTGRPDARRGAAMAVAVMPRPR
jgi:hypothetical protein